MSIFEIYPKVPKAKSEELSAYDGLLQQLLYNRGITTNESADSFLNPTYEKQLHDPFLLHDMDKAVSRVLEAIKREQKIVIFSDYDCDGIPGAVVLHDFFTAIKFTNFFNFIPHRHYDGFGLSEKIIEKIKIEQNPTLIITIDCGTTDSKAVALAKTLGIEVIITDHHEPKEKLPEAVAVINPKIGTSYPFSGLCGAGVVYKLVQALIARGDFALPKGIEKWWLDMVGVATIADMVPLIDENRILANFGLLVLRKSRRPGLQQLLRKQRTDQRYLTEEDVGFTISPRINAASRMDNPEDAFFMLATKDEVEAKERVMHLEKLNVERKTAVAQMTKEVHARLKGVEEIPDILVIGNPEWRPALVGLTANKLAEEYRRPAFIWGRDGNGIIKGSCRSGGKISVIDIMQSAPELFIEFGGHLASGGFSVWEDKIHTFASELLKAYKNLGKSAQIEEPLLVDFELTLEEFTTSLLRAQRQCAPFGCANHKPLYLVRNVIPQAVTVFGKNKEHTKLEFSTKGIVKEAIAFFKNPEQFSVTPTNNKPISLLAHLEESFFMNRLQTRLRIVDVF